MPPEPHEIIEQLACLHFNDAPPRRLCPSCPTFLDLPPEIRNAIYNHLFPPGKAAAQLLARRNGGYTTMSARFNTITICRQIFRETTSFMKGNNRVNVVPPKGIFEQFPTRLGNDAWGNFMNAHLVKHVIHRCWPDDRRVIAKEYNLTAGTIYCHVPELLRVSRDLREWTGDHLDSSDISLTMTTNKPKSYFGIEFHRLKEKIGSGLLEHLEYYYP
ncbi:hypothetical protein E8E11_005677 [Didymella keratinophila]|nr:hypothetical protein E8E11_005677 [Didymella keratinophila]